MAITRFRKLLYVLGGLVLLLVAGLTVLVATFDPNAYKGLAIDWMKKERNRTLRIEGPIELSVFPRVQVEMSQVTLSEAGRPEEFAHLDEVALSVSTLPLLRKRLEVDRVTAKGLRATYRRAADGASNIDDLLKPKDDQPAAEAGPEGQALAFDVQAVRVDDLRLTVRDAVAKVDGTLAVTSFSTGRLADGAESPVEIDARLDLTQPPLKGRLTGKTTLTLDLPKQAVQLRGMELAWLGDAFGVRALDTRVAGAVAWNGAAGTVQADDLNVRVGATLGALRLEGSTLAVKSFGYEPARQRLSLEQLAVRVAGTQAGHPLKLDLDWPRLAVEGTRLEGGPVSGSLGLEGPNAVDVTFKSTAPTGTFERIDLPGFQATVKGRSGARQINGTLASNLQLDVKAQALAINALNGRLRFEEPSLQPLDLAVQGRASASAKAAQWNLSGDINKNPFTTEGRAQLDAKPLALTASAQFQSLDLNRLLPPAAAPGAAPKPSTSGSAPAGAGDAEPVDLSALKSMNARIDFRAGALAYRQYRARQVVMQATIDQGRLRVSPFSGDVWGGRLDFTATADANAGRVGLKGAAAGIDIAALLRDVADKDLLEGTGRVTLDVTTQGRTLGALKAGLDGSAAVQLRDGAIKGVNLAQRLRQAKAALSTSADADVRASNAEKTDFSELNASFALANGIARSSDLDVKSPFLRMGGDGLIDIPKSRIDYTVRTTVAETSKGQGGADLAQLRGVTVPVRLTGPLDAVEWNIRWSQVAADVLKSQVGKKVEGQLRDRLNEQLGLPPRSASAPEGSPQKPKDVLKEGLRGILGR